MDPDPPSLILYTAFNNTGQLLGISVLILLLICSALISGAEVALFSLSATDLEANAQKPSKKQAIVEKLLKRPKKLLATILVANNFINIAIVLLFESLSSVWFEGLDAVIYLGLFNVDTVFFLKVGIAAFIILLFGEILPKIYASRNNIKFANFMAIPLNIMDVLFMPLTRPMQNITLVIQDKFGPQKSNLNVDKLSKALELTSKDDTTTEEHKLLKGIVTFGNTEVRQIMQPRMDIFALNQNLKYHDVIQDIIKKGYSRIPVYKENIDSITGILYVKDLIPHINKEQFNWTKLQRAPYFVPENKKLDDLLNEFKDKIIHLAIVVDEYGGTSGLITLEDILEEIVGDISDEFDTDDLVYSKLDDHNYIFEGKTQLVDFYRIIHLEQSQLFEAHKGEAETLAGFLLEISKGFPKKKEIIKFHNYAFTVEVFDSNRIKQIKFTIGHD